MINKNLGRIVGGRLGMLAAIGICGLSCLSVSADQRRFAYTYEPETNPKGEMELEQWVTLRSQRSEKGDEPTENFNKWELSTELEYGFTDNYTVGLYLNYGSESFRDLTTGEDVSNFEFGGIAVENRYMVLNPAEHAIGLTLYLEPAFSGSEAELEQKIIVGQRYGDWKWAANLVHATEWKDNFHETEGEFEANLGVARDLNPNWSLGIEFRNHNEIPEYETWENTAFFLGPAVSYRQEKWWAALTVLPQIYGKNFIGNPDGNTSLELEGHERVNIRFVIGIEL